MAEAPRNERAWRSEADVRTGLLAICEAMRQCVKRGCEREGQLPGLQVERRAGYCQVKGAGGKVV